VLTIFSGIVTSAHSLRSVPFKVKVVPVYYIKRCFPKKSQTMFRRFSKKLLSDVGSEFKKMYSILIGVHGMP
jgi:hypothetical protein